MFSKTRSKLVAASNWLLLSICLITVPLALHDRIFSAPSKQPELGIGQTIPVPNVNWSRTRSTVVLAMQVGCHYCTDSAAFYKRLTRHVTSKGFQIVAVSPQSVQRGKQYLEFLGVNIPTVLQSPLHSLNVKSTPTLLLIDHQGRITHSWVGELDSIEEADVFRTIEKS